MSDCTKKLNYNLLIIDDQKSITNALKFAFEDKFNVECANNLIEFNDLINRVRPDLVLLDLKFGTENGIDLLKHIKSVYPDSVVIMMTAYGSIKSSIEAIKLGAYDYELKPIDLSHAKELLDNAVIYAENRKKNTILESNTNVQIIGNSSKMNQVFEKINKIKDVDVDV